MLTDTAIRRATPGERDYKMTDAKGLFLLVTKRAATVGLEYRFEGREKKASFGQYPEAALAKVRVLHANGRRLLASGVDPMLQRKTEKQPTVGFRSARWLPSGTIPGEMEAAHHVKATWSRLDSNVYPALGVRPIAAYNHALSTIQDDAGLGELPQTHAA